MKTEGTVGYKKLCSNTCCYGEAVQLEPRHLCGDCIKKEEKPRAPGKSSGEDT